MWRLLAQQLVVRIQLKYLSADCHMKAPVTPAAAKTMHSSASFVLPGWEAVMRMGMIKNKSLISQF